MKVREYSLHEERERQHKAKEKKKNEEQESRRLAQKEECLQSAGAEATAQTKKSKMKSLKKRFTESFMQKSKKRPEKVKSYAQHPIAMNTFIRKRGPNFFPNMEKASYLIRRSPDGSCLIVDK